MLGHWPAFRAALIEALGRDDAAEFLAFAARVMREEARLHREREAHEERDAA